MLAGLIEHLAVNLVWRLLRGLFEQLFGGVLEVAVKIRFCFSFKVWWGNCLIMCSDFLLDVWMHFGTKHRNGIVRIVWCVLETCLDRKGTPRGLQGSLGVHISLSAPGRRLK